MSAHPIAAREPAQLRRHVIDLAGMDPDARFLLPIFIRSRWADALELQQCIEVRDFDRVARIGHRITGSARTYGFDVLGRLGADVELAARSQDVGAVLLLAAELRAWADELESESKAVVR